VDRPASRWGAAFRETSASIGHPVGRVNRSGFATRSRKARPGAAGLCEATGFAGATKWPITFWVPRPFANCRNPPGFMNNPLRAFSKGQRPADLQRFRARPESGGGAFGFSPRRGPRIWGGVGEIVLGSGALMEGLGASPGSRKVLARFFKFPVMENRFSPHFSRCREGCGPRPGQVPFLAGQAFWPAHFG